MFRFRVAKNAKRGTNQFRLKVNDGSVDEFQRVRVNDYFSSFFFENPKNRQRKEKESNTYFNVKLKAMQSHLNLQTLFLPTSIFPMRLK